MKTKKLTLSAMLVAMGVLAGHVIYIPIGAAKCQPVQHAINVIGAVFLGPLYSVITAFLISLIRNILGTGSIFAFPGSMVGALVAALVYKYSKSNTLTGVGEVIGTGVIGAIISAPISKYIAGTEIAAFYFVTPFIISSLGGAIIGVLLLKSTEVLRLGKKVS